MYNASDMTREQFETHVDALQAALSKHFSLNTSKKGKLRDVAAKTLFGLDHGFQQALPAFLACVAIPLPSSDLSLDDRVDLVSSSGDSDVYVTRSGTLSRHGYTYGDVVHVLREEMELFDHEFDSPELGDSDSLADSEVIRHLYHRYEIDEVIVLHPDSDKYGMPPVAHYSDARKFLRSLCLNIDHLDDPALQSAITTIDYGDDSSDMIVVRLKQIA